ncbi:MAG: hypothetical protein AABX52_01310 [Nanoarchaeota archaeon]
MPINWKYTTILFRTIYLLLLAWYASNGMLNIVIVCLVPYLVTLPLLFFAKKNKAYYTLDTTIMLIFLINTSVFLTDYYDKEPYILGFDKLLHALSGAWLAGFAAVTTRKYITNNTIFFIGMIIFAIAIGGTWEVFEWIFSLLPEGINIASKGYADSMQDIIAVSIGSIITTTWIKLRNDLLG